MVTLQTVTDAVEGKTDNSWENIGKRSCTEESRGEHGLFQYKSLLTCTAQPTHPSTLPSEN